MAAKFCVVSGPLTGEEFPVNLDVVRIGRSHECHVELQLPGLDDLVAMARIEHDVCRVFNNGQSPIVVDNVKTAPKEWASLRYGGTLELRTDCTLRLDQYTPPSQPEAPLAFDVGEEDRIHEGLAEYLAEEYVSEVTPESILENEEVAQEEETSASSKQVVQIFISIMCLAFVGFVLWGEKLSPKSSHEIIAHDELLTRLNTAVERESQQTAAPQTPRLSQLLALRFWISQGHLHEGRQSQEEARQCYSEAYRVLGINFNRTDGKLDHAKSAAADSPDLPRVNSSRLEEYLTDELDRDILRFLRSREASLDGT